MQKLQYLLQPSMMETKAVAPSARGSGRRSNFSISGKLTSTTARPVRRSSAIISGRRCRVCGPNTRSTKGARCVMRLALLARDAAAHADDHVRPLQP